MRNQKTVNITILAFVFFLALASVSYAQAQQIQDFDPKTVESITLKIVQNGQLAIAGTVERMNLTLYIPQEGVQTLDVNSNQQVNWRYDNDRFGNKVVVLEWIKPTGIATYQIDIVVKNDAKLITSLADIGSNPIYLNQTSSIVINDDIRKLAYPFEKSWDNVARLTALVYNLVNYDISTVGKRYSSEWVLQNKRGVCVEHANLLTAMLRASGTPTRYVVGYAYSNVDKKLIGHTWIEVFASDGSWVPFDPTWLQGAYVDATHIKTANLLDDKQLDVLTYKGNGNVTWKRGSDIANSIGLGDLYTDTVDIISYRTRNITKIDITSPVVGLGDYGYVRAHVSPSVCAITHLNIAPCVDQNGKDAFEVLEQNQTFFSCTARDVYWFYKEAGNGRPYKCPVTVYDQTGGVDSFDVNVVGQSIGASNITITGPSIVDVGEQFTLTANSRFSPIVFYSPEFGRHTNNIWDLKINRPRNYKFYLYAASALDTKTVSVVEQKAFDIDVKIPTSAKYGSTFLANVSIKNLLERKTASVQVQFDGQTTERMLTFEKNEEKLLQFNFTANTPGQGEFIVLVSADTLTPYTTTINVEQPPKVERPLGGIIDAIAGFFSFIADFFGNLF